MELHHLVIPVVLLHLPTGLSEEVLPLLCTVGRGGVLSCDLDNSCPGAFMRHSDKSNSILKLLYEI